MQRATLYLKTTQAPAISPVPRQHTLLFISFSSHCVHICQQNVQFIQLLRREQVFLALRMLQRRRRSPAPPKTTLNGIVNEEVSADVTPAPAGRSPATTFLPQRREGAQGGRPFSSRGVLFSRLCRC